jgi:nuclear pore complex protein Nup62
VEETLYTLYDCMSVWRLQVASALNVVAGELSYSVDKINELASASLGDPNTPMGSVVRVLNNQLQALGQIEARTAELEKQIEGVKTAL